MADPFDAAWDEFDSAWESEPFDLDAGQWASVVDNARAKEPEGSYAYRFADELTDPESFKKTLLNAPASAWNALKGMAGAVAELPQNVRNIAADPMGAIERNGIKTLGAIGGAAASYNPLGFITGPLYDKALQFADPVNFPETSPEQDAARVRGELLTAGAGVGATKTLQRGAADLQRVGTALKEKLGTKVIPEQTIPGYIPNEFVPAKNVPAKINPAYRKPGKTFEGGEFLPDDISEISELGVTTTPRSIPEVSSVSTPFKPIPSVEDAITPAARAAALGRGKSVVDGELVSSLDEAIASNADIISMPPQKAAIALADRKAALFDELDALVDNAAPKAPSSPAISKEVTVSTPATTKNIGGMEFEVSPAGTSKKTVNVPAKFDIETPRVDKFLESGVADPLMREALVESVTARKVAKLNEFDGNLKALHELKKEIYKDSAPLFRKPPASLTPAEKVEVLLAQDLNDILRQNIKGYGEVNSRLSDAIRIEKYVDKAYTTAEGIQRANRSAIPKKEIIREGSEVVDVPAYSTLGEWVPEKVVKQAVNIPARTKIGARVADKVIPEQVIEGPWAGKLNKAVNILAPAAGAVAATSAGPLGMLGAGGLAAAGIRGLKEAGITPASALARAAQGAGGMAGLAKKFAFDPAAGIASSPLRGVLAGEAVEEQFLPRDSARFGEDQLARFLMETAQTAQAPVAQQLAEKFRKAKRAQDMDTVERLHADMARLFPDAFEPGFGVNQKLFYPDEQAKYMETLEKLNRMGQVDSEVLAKQQNAFADPQDRRILPLPGLISKMNQQNRNDAMRYGPQGQRQYDY